MQESNRWSGNEIPVIIWKAESTGIPRCFRNIGQIGKRGYDVKRINTIMGSKWSVRSYKRSFLKRLEMKTEKKVIKISQSYLLCESVHPFFPLWQFSFYFSHSYSLFYIIVFVQFSLNFLSCIHTFVQITWQKKSNYVKSILNITESSKNFAE